MKLAITALVLAVPALAAAQPALDHDAGTVWLGGGVSVLTAGTLDGGTVQTIDQGAASIHADLTSTLAANAIVEDQLTDAIAIGLAPRYVLAFADGPGTAWRDSWTMLDTRVRLSVGGHLTRELRVYGLGAVGYAIIFGPTDSTSTTRPAGLTFTVGGGASFAFTPHVRAYAELGYEVGREDRPRDPFTGYQHVDYAELGAGLEVALGR
jgi:hypothetical protein